MFRNQWPRKKKEKISKDLEHLPKDMQHYLNECTPNGAPSHSRDEYLQYYNGNLHPKLVNEGFDLPTQNPREANNSTLY